jgi:hypothetical protein
VLIYIEVLLVIWLVLLFTAWFFTVVHFLDMGSARKSTSRGFQIANYYLWIAALLMYIWMAEATYNTDVEEYEAHFYGNYAKIIDGPYEGIQITTLHDDFKANGYVGNGETVYYRRYGNSGGIILSGKNGIYKDRR